MSHRAWVWLDVPEGTPLGRLIQALNTRLSALAGKTKAYDGLAHGIVQGVGDPEGVVAAKIGTLFLRSDGGVSTTLYVKEGDDGLDTGWAAK